MGPQLSALSTSADPRGLPAFPLATDRHMAALRELNTAYEQQRPVVIMLGEGKQEFSHVISAFLHGLPDRTTVARLRQPYEDALAAMRAVSTALGFEPNDLVLSDLKNILTMFLDYQSQHHQRTVLLIEQVDEQGSWLSDCVANLLTSERSGQGGLIVILSGSPRLGDQLSRSSFDVIRKHAGCIVRLAPFTFSETKAFICQRSSSLGLGDIHELYEFEAVDRLHKLSGGTPHLVAQLCQESSVLIGGGKNGPVTAKVVSRAARQLRLEPANDSVLSVVGTSSETGAAESAARVLVRHKGEAQQEISIRCGRYLIGRTKSADICLSSLLVSRQHALILKTSTATQILDLGSTNGICVDGHRVAEYTVIPGLVFTIGDFEIEFVAE